MKTTRRTFLKLLGGATAVIALPLAALKDLKKVFSTLYVGELAITVHYPDSNSIGDGDLVLSEIEKSDTIDFTQLSDTGRYVRAKMYFHPNKEETLTAMLPTPINYYGEGNGQ